MSEIVVQSSQTASATPTPGRGMARNQAAAAGDAFSSLLLGLAANQPLAVIEQLDRLGQHLAGALGARPALEGTLVVVDDLSQHAATHRELALLMQQPPGREAYPGDIFYVHARLLERAAKLSAARGGGSLTALPIAQTEAGNLSAYIPTNLISITDGQIVLDSRLFDLGQLPAVDTGLSVSRVGGKTQAPLMREAVNSLRLDYAVFQELEMFTRFGTELDARVQQQMARGRCIRAVLAQPRLAPQPAALQLALLMALQAGWLDGQNPAGLPALLERLRRALPGVPELAARLAYREALDAPALKGLQQDLGQWFSQVAGVPAGGPA